MRDMPNPDLIGTTEAAEVIGIERSTISRWVKDGALNPAHRMTGQTGAFLFHRSEVERVAAEYQSRKASA